MWAVDAEGRVKVTAVAGIKFEMVFGAAQLLQLYSMVDTHIAWYT